MEDTLVNRILRPRREHSLLGVCIQSGREDGANCLMRLKIGVICDEGASNNSVKSRRWHALSAKPSSPLDFMFRAVPDGIEQERSGRGRDVQDHAGNRWHYSRRQYAD